MRMMMHDDDLVSFLAYIQVYTQSYSADSAQHDVGSSYVEVSATAR